MNKDVLTTYDIAKYCKVSPRTVVQWIGKGMINAYRTPGNHSRVKVQDFLAFLKKYNMPVSEELEVFQARDQKKKILIVDDDRNMALSIKRILVLEGNYRLELAFDGFDAGRKVFEFKPDLVILDIRMPGMNGYEVAQRIKEIPDLQDTKIIAISAFFEEDGKEKILSLGASACLDKPYTQEVLLEAIKKIMKE